MIPDPMRFRDYRELYPGPRRYAVAAWLLYRATLWVDDRSVAAERRTIKKGRDNF